MAALRTVLHDVVKASIAGIIGNMLLAWCRDGRRGLRREQLSIRLVTDLGDAHTSGDRVNPAAFKPH